MVAAWCSAVRPSNTSVRLVAPGSPMRSSASASASASGAATMGPGGVGPDSGAAVSEGAPAGPDQRPVQAVSSSAAVARAWARRSAAARPACSCLCSAVCLSPRSCSRRPRLPWASLIACSSLRISPTSSRRAATRARAVSSRSSPESTGPKPSSAMPDRCAASVRSRAYRSESFLAAAARRVSLRAASSASPRSRRSRPSRLRWPATSRAPASSSRRLSSIRPCALYSSEFFSPARRPWSVSPSSRRAFRSASASRSACTARR